MIAGRALDLEHLMTFKAYTDHKPRPKGSLLPERAANGRVRMKESVDPAGVWRGILAEAARAEARRIGLTEPWDCPVLMRAVLLFRRPAGTEREYPDRQEDGDVEKLYRNVSDALQDVKIFTNDARVVGHLDSWKIWAPAGTTPGAVISLYRAPDMMVPEWIGVEWS